jgi:Family of unknown function (DUF6496)
MARKVPHVPGGPREERIEEKLKPGLHKKVRKEFKKEHPGRKMTHAQEQKLEEKIAPGIHKRVERVSKKKKDPKKKKPTKIAKVMREFGHGELHSGSKKGPVVTNPKQAVAIALSEQRKERRRK